MTKDWRLNERHYGGLTGLNKAETAAKHGEDQVKIWRRSYDIPPPELAPGGEYDFAKDRRYAGLDLPTTESLKTTLERVQPYWDGRDRAEPDGRRDAAGRRPRQLRCAPSSSTCSTCPTTTSSTSRSPPATRW